MKREREAEASSTLLDLLVVLGTQRFGTDWPNVRAAVRAAIGPLDCEAPTVDECEQRFRALIEGAPSELPALAAKLQTKRLESLAATRASIVDRLEELCKDLPAGHSAQAALTSAHEAAAGTLLSPGSDVGKPAFGAADASEADDNDAAARTGGRRKSATASDLLPESELKESWAVIAEDEERNTRRATIGGTLTKLLAAIATHKWAYPFKRPVTDKVTARAYPSTPSDVPVNTSRLLTAYQLLMLAGGPGLQGHHQEPDGFLDPKKARRNWRSRRHRFHGQRFELDL
jgi:hypothetical protein